MIVALLAHCNGLSNYSDEQAYIAWFYSENNEQRWKLGQCQSISVPSKVREIFYLSFRSPELGQPFWSFLPLVVTVIGVKVSNPKVQVGQKSDPSKQQETLQERFSEYLLGRRDTNPRLPNLRVSRQHPQPCRRGLEPGADRTNGPRGRQIARRTLLIQTEKPHPSKKLEWGMQQLAADYCWGWGVTVVVEVVSFFTAGGGALVVVVVSVTCG